MNIFVILLSFISSSFACANYSLNVKSIVNCEQNPVIKIEEKSQVFIGDDCLLLSNICVSTSGFEIAMAKIKIVQMGFLTIVNETIDLCDSMAKAEDAEKSLLELLGLPTRCPVAKTSICTNPSQRMDITDYSSLLPLINGEMAIDIRIDHGNRGKSCLQIKLEVNQINRSMDGRNNNIVPFTLEDFLKIR